MMPAKGRQQLRDRVLDQCMHVAEIVESNDAIADEEYVVKRQRTDNFNITESLNVAVSG
jgi:hypothetical protein